MAISRHGYENVAFTKPGGAATRVRSPRPIDLSHLSRQTMGDRGLECDVLGIFVEQAQAMRRQLADADVEERRFLAHTLKGSARGVGAFPIAECAGEIELNPANRAALRRLSRLIDDACDFIASIDR